MALSLTLRTVFLTGLLSGCTAQASPRVDWSQQKLAALDGTTLQADALDNKVVLVVNVASQCGFTPQYEGLQALHDELSPKGFTVLGVPCNQFGSQEPGTAEQIQSFCKLNYGVTFPLLEKQDVNGDNRSPLYQALIGDGGNIKWNFEKILVDRSGQVVGRWTSLTKPDSGKLRKAIDSALGAEGGS